MAKKVARSASTGKFTVVRGKSDTVVIEKATGKRLPLKGYGALKGKFDVKEGIDLTKPIYDQVRPKGGTKAKSLAASALASKNPVSSKGSAKAQAVASSALRQAKPRKSK